MKIVLIGAGNVATHLGLALHKAHHDIVQVYSRTTQSAQLLAELLSCAHTSDIQSLYPAADVYIYAVKDDFVQHIMDQIHLPHAIHLHTAGSIPLYAPHEGHYGVIYPLQTFSKERSVDFRNIPICIEGDSDQTAQAIHALAQSISTSVHRISSEQRRQLHLAAVFACNFVNALYANAAEILQLSHMSFDLLLPLIQETAAKVQTLSPVEAQTGPAKRDDKGVMQRHLSLLSSPTQQEIYRLLSHDIHTRHKQ